MFCMSLLHHGSIIDYLLKYSLCKITIYTKGSFLYS